jgi:hypothetical protein
MQDEGPDSRRLAFLTICYPFITDNLLMRGGNRNGFSRKEAISYAVERKISEGIKKGKE